MCGVTVTQRVDHRFPWQLRGGARQSQAKLDRAWTHWLIDERHGLKDVKPTQDYEAKKEAARARNANIARAGRDIAPLPEVVDQARKAAARTSFRLFCERYFPFTFTLAWSKDHLKVIAKIGECTRLQRPDKSMS